MTLLQRMREGLQEALSGRTDQRIIGVGHGGILTACICYLCNNINLREIVGVHIANCAITSFEAAEQQNGQLRGRRISWANSHHLSDTNDDRSLH